jgi:hypothetical protein
MINASYDASYWVLVAEYLILFLLAFWALVQLLIKNNLKHGWQRNFFALLLLGCLGRCSTRSMVVGVEECGNVLIARWVWAGSSCCFVLVAAVHHGRESLHRKQGMYL